MMTLRRADQRLHDQRRCHDTWCTFFSPERAVPFAEGFGILETLNEDRLPPGASSSVDSFVESEVLTYVCEGALTHSSRAGASCVLRAGEFQQWSASSTNKCRCGNALRSHWTHAFHMGFRAGKAQSDSGPSQKRFNAADRRRGLCVVASPDGRRGSLRLHQDAVVYSALSIAGQHIVHELLPGRSAWLHIVKGEATLANTLLTAGDGAGISAERGISLTAKTEAELLLVELGEQLRRADVRAGWS
jgi:redox-sensitive bicupin YhaK (pirin superfamily)